MLCSMCVMYSYSTNYFVKYIKMYLNLYCFMIFHGFVMTFLCTASLDRKKKKFQNLFWSNFKWHISLWPTIVLFSITFYWEGQIGKVWVKWGVSLLHKCMFTLVSPGHDAHQLCVSKFLSALGSMPSEEWLEMMQAHDWWCIALMLI